MAYPGDKVEYDIQNTNRNLESIDQSRARRRASIATE
jgi:hypothetical protein